MRTSSHSFLAALIVLTAAAWCWYQCSAHAGDREEIEDTGSNQTVAPGDSTPQLSRRSPETSSRTPYSQVLPAPIAHGGPPREIAWLGVSLSLTEDVPLTEATLGELRDHVELGCESTSRHLEEHLRRFGDNEYAFALRRILVSSYAMLEMFEAGEYLSVKPMGVGALEGARHLIDGGASIIYANFFANQGNPAQVIFILPWKRFPKLVEAMAEEEKAKRRELDRLNKK